MIRGLSSNATNKKISRLALVKAFDNWRVNMNQENGSAPAQASASSSRHTEQTRLQSVEDFTREQDEADALKAAEVAANLTTNPTKKQRKATLQAERDRLEAEQRAKKAGLEAEKKSIDQQANEAIHELGAINWVGKLLGTWLITLFEEPIC
jgi:phosphoenolpyruvate carboxylase